MKEYRVKVNEIELQLQDEGQHDEVIIFLHFGGANLMVWQRVLPYFQDKYRLILVDLRGHGKSDKPQDDYDIDVMASDIIGVMQQIRLEKAHVIGSSLGAEVGLSMAANYPDRVTSLVCDGALASEFGPFSTWEGSEAEFEQHVAEQMGKMRNMAEKVFPSVEAYVASRRDIFEPMGWWNESVAAMERYNACERADGTYAKAFGKQAMLSYMAHYFSYRFENYYKRVTCPLLLLPDEDVLADERETAVMEKLCALAPQAVVADIKDWNHPYGWLLEPENACHAILEFLDDIFT